MNQNNKRVLSLLPLRGVIVFPYTVIHLDVGREKSIKALDEAMVNDQVIFLASQKEALTEDPTVEDVFPIGTIAEVKQLLKLPGGTIRVLVEGIRRGKIIEFNDDKAFIQVLLEETEEDIEKTPEVEALMRNAAFQFEQYVKISKKIPLETLTAITEMEDPGRLADSIASHLILKVKSKQALLEAINPKERLQKLCEILRKEIEILEVEKKINVHVRRQMDKNQKEYYLREQMKAIKKELGEKDEVEVEAEQLQQKAQELDLPKDVKERLLKEIKRLEKMPPMAAEAVVVRNYVDWLLNLPWRVKTDERLDVEAAEAILNKDHYGLEKVKERILEHIAVRKLAPDHLGTILMLVGPPGVGKTSLAQSIARAMERQFVRVSLGGVRDEAEIRGHRRTYVGALPGRIMQGMRQAKSRNPVFLLDEIDKMSMDFRGDPSAALLEVLDPEQNHAFSDHFVELPFDLSDVMFITTANNVENVPRPLLDRMEMIDIAGYTEEEKINIAKQYLWPKQLKKHGLDIYKVSLSETVIGKIIREYTRESGVRNLERNLATLCRKSAKKIVSGVEKQIKISLQNLHQFLGTEKFRYGVAEKKDEIGTATGLAWTPVGGDVLSIEVSVMPGKGKLTLTGQLGEVMQESAQAGYSYVRANAPAMGIELDFYENKDIHIHVPEGAIPKDGPSAGITMATALASALSNKSIRCDVAMTGEITLRGKVLPVGGIKEKVLAAHRAGIKKIILSARNKRNFEDIPINIRRKLEFVWVESLEEVLKEALVEETHEY